MKNIIFLNIAVPLLFLLLTANSGNAQKVRNGNKVDIFTLLNVNGKNLSLQDFPTAKGFIIVFTCNHCPFAKLYPPRLNALHARFSGQGVPLIAISSTDTLKYMEDTYPKMVNRAKAESFQFPYLFDGTQAVAKNFHADKTPHAFVIWKEQTDWVVRYNGAIDDNGGEPEKVTQNFVANAVEALLANRPVAVPETKSIGCQISFRK